MRVGGLGQKDRSGRHAHRLVGALLLLCVCLLTSPVRAVSPEEKSAARDAATAGIHAFQEGDYDRALDLLRKAEAIVHAPPHLIYIARAHAAKREFVLARETLMILTNEELAPDAPSAFRDAQTAGHALKAEIEPKIGRVSIHVEGPSGQPPDKTLVVTVDGKEVPSAIVGLPYPVDPGERAIEAQSESAHSEVVTITVAEGQSQEVTLRLVTDEAVLTPPPEPPPKAPPPPQPPEPAPRKVSPLVFVGFGTAAVGVIVGAISGGLSLAKTGDTKAAHCTGNACTPAAAPGLDEANTLANVSNVAFGVAALGVAVGIYGLLTPPQQDSPPTRARLTSPVGHLAVSPQGVQGELTWHF